MKCKLVNVIKAVCIVSFCTSALSQTIMKVADSTQADKLSNKYFECKSSTYRGQRIGLPDLYIDCSKDKDLDCRTRRFEFVNFKQEGGSYVYRGSELIMHPAGSEYNYNYNFEISISRNSGAFRINGQTSFGTGDFLTGECELKTESLKF